jgi:hypothetical protein
MEKLPKSLASVIFKNAQSKQQQNRGKIAQSGHPGANTSIVSYNTTSSLTRFEYNTYNFI